MNNKLEITSDLRIRASLPTIQYILHQGAAVILIAHLGRPKGQIIDKLRMQPIYDYLKSKLTIPVQYVRETVGPEVTKALATLRPGHILLLENLRFHLEETQNDPDFAQTLASYADIYVNEAFGTAHRVHASTVGITHYLPAVTGFLMQQELNYLGHIIDQPKRPFIAIVGGKKVNDKIKILKRLLERCDHILIGGGIAFTFFKALGKCIGTSILDEADVALATETLELAQRLDKSLILPEDIVIADAFDNAAQTQVVDWDMIPEGWMGLDIGPKTIQKYKKIIQQSKMVIWNGILGVFEFPRFARGSQAIAQILSEADVFSIIAGGDSAAAIQQFGLAPQMTYISTGGGAALQLLEGKSLPAIVALNDLESKLVKIHIPTSIKSAGNRNP